MRRIYDPDALEAYLNQYHILDCFDTEHLPFFLAEYERGEMLVQPLKPPHSLIFVVKGTVSLYSIRQNGSVYRISSSDEFTLLGDMEFVNDQLTVFFAEAKTEVLAVCLSVDQNRAKLDADQRFLHYLLSSLSQKLHYAAVNEACFVNLEERLMHYITFSSPGQTITQVGHTAENLHCSKRQLQRVLKKLVEEGKLLKDGKGAYRLAGPMK